jgi:hypothetical protein
VGNPENFVDEREVVSQVDHAVGNEGVQTPPCVEAQLVLVEASGDRGVCEIDIVVTRNDVGDERGQDERFPDGVVTKLETVIPERSMVLAVVDRELVRAWPLVLRIRPRNGRGQGQAIRQAIPDVEEHDVRANPTQERGRAVIEIVASAIEILITESERAFPFRGNPGLSEEPRR